MEVAWRPWLNFRRPYRVTAREVYEVHRTSRFGLIGDDPYYVMDVHVHHWLEDLPALENGRKPISYEFCSDRFIDVNEFLKRPRKIPPPPPIWFARKSDIIMFKLTWGGR